MTSTFTNPNSAISTMISAAIEKPEQNLFQIIHLTRGRIRIRLPQLKNNPAYTERLIGLIRSLDFVTDVHINQSAMSLSIGFAPEVCSESTLLNSIAFAIHRAGKALPGRHTTSALAQRLGLTSQAITCHRMRVDFAEWSQARDPEGFSWRYDAASGTFHPQGIHGDASVQSSSKGQKILQSLSQAAGGRLGASMGRMAGQAIGLLFLGAVGMAVGAEVGTLVGEIVGAELAAVEAIEKQ